jgi:hypothetical protein
VVEDEEPLQEIVHDALKDGGFDLTTVAIKHPRPLRGQNGQGAFLSTSAQRGERRKSS